MMVPQRYRTALFQAFLRYAASLERKSRALVGALRPFVDRAIPYWILGWLALAALRMVSAPAPIASFTEFASVFLPYAMIALAPPLGFRLAEAAFPAGVDKWEPQFRLAFVGRWEAIDRDSARRHPMFGPVGFMASLLIGLLLNVVLRSGEFLIAVPAVSMAGPDWARAIFLAMAFEVVAMNFLYLVCFVMALRTIPLFPRMLALTWMFDIALQLTTAGVVKSQADLPAEVATALVELLQGNITKVLISVAVWLPYLLLSDRVNVTYRSRLPA
ncbi:DUF2569 domain-containing protein [Qipengyuania sp. 6B39]|uniref:DUF2569 domain-containing protein n=1 Tax=Qipengyuania proteolytica TaxID=2867239 RepID=UPI001C898014|nr:DUF2569 domain-containing protein [Qipengyuania proteolytica]MBX7495012.1 DUF2569 domain-containing protein [Qipengyuania proteolytica]